MRHTSLSALVGIVAVAVASTPGAAQQVPVPKPAPQPKVFARPLPQPASGVAPAPPRRDAVGQGSGQNGTSQNQSGLNSLLPFRLPWDSGKGGSNTTAFDPGQRALVERVNAYLMSVQTLVGDFTQVGPDGSKAEGKLYLQKPGRIRFEYNAPSPIELVADGQSLVVRDRKLATQDLYPLSQTPLRFLLSDRIDLLRDTNLIRVHADDLFVSVLIEEKQTFGGSHRLMLMFNAKDMQLRQWTVTDPQGFDTTVAVYNLDTSKRLDPGLFKINYERVIQ